MGLHPFPRMRVRVIFAAAWAVAILACGGRPPGAPTVDRSEADLYLRCGVPTATSLMCTAFLSCWLYGCPGGLVPGDVTEDSQWSVDDAAVATVTGKGVVVSRSPGKTSIRAIFRGDKIFHDAVSATATQQIAVYPGTAPLVLFTRYGSVYEGPARNEAPVNGALVEVIAGLAQGTTAVTGPPLIAGGYALKDIPDGVMTLRVSKIGYVTVVREITAAFDNSLPFEIQLQRANQ
jgi:hypothetical protein